MYICNNLRVAYVLPSLKHKISTFLCGRMRWLSLFLTGIQQRCFAVEKGRWYLVRRVMHRHEANHEQQFPLAGAHYLLRISSAFQFPRYTAGPGMCLLHVLRFANVHELPFSFREKIFTTNWISTVYKFSLDLTPVVHPSVLCPIYTLYLLVERRQMIISVAFNIVYHL